jgi:hypothetical protein
MTNFIILGFRFPLEGVFRGFQGGKGGKLRDLSEKGIYIHIFED